MVLRTVLSLACVGVALGCQPATTPPEPEGAVPPAAGETLRAPEPEPQPLGETTVPDAPDPGPSEVAEVEDVRLTLTADCQLTAEQGGETFTHKFRFPAECHFSKDAKAGLRIVATDHGKAVLVESSEPDGDKHCLTSLQVVVVAKEGPRLSKQIQHVAMCAPGVWDEMMFHVLASDRVTLGTPEAST
ncbi:MAG: hypothetical protein AAF721_24685 [Myxococcota bacterium]